MKKNPKTRGIRILIVLSPKSCLGPRFLIAKQTPIPETIKSMGMRQIFSNDMGIHKISKYSLFVIKNTLGPKGMNAIEV